MQIQFEVQRSKINSNISIKNPRLWFEDHFTYKIC